MAGTYTYAHVCICVCGPGQLKAFNGSFIAEHSLGFEPQPGIKCY